jgi:hypothetical protein
MGLGAGEILGDLKDVRTYIPPWILKGLKSRMISAIVENEDSKNVSFYQHPIKKMGDMIAARIINAGRLSK